MSIHLARLQLADAMAAYLGQHHPQIDANRDTLVALMRPRLLNWADDNEAETQAGSKTDHTSSPPSSPSTGAPNTGHDYFGPWSSPDTPFYFLVDFHVLACNLIMDHVDVEFDLKDMYMTVSRSFYAAQFHFGQLETEAQGQTEETKETFVNDGGLGPGHAGHSDSNSDGNNTVVQEPMDTNVMAAAAQYGFMTLDYLREYIDHYVYMFFSWPHSLIHLPELPPAMEQGPIFDAESCTTVDIDGNTTQNGAGSTSNGDME